MKRFIAKLLKKEICPQCSSLKTHAHYGDSKHCEWEYAGHSCSNCLNRWDCMMLGVDVKKERRTMQEWVEVNELAKKFVKKELPKFMKLHDKEEDDYELNS